METFTKPRMIMAVTMEDDRSPWEAFCSWDGRKLSISRLASISTKEKSWQDKLSAKIKRLTEQNVHVVVEDRPGFVTGPAARLMLDDCGFHDGRTNFSHAMDWYYSLQAAGGLAFPSGTPANYMIDREKVERKKDSQAGLYTIRPGNLFTAAIGLSFCSSWER